MNLLKVSHRHTTSYQELFSIAYLLKSYFLDVSLRSKPPQVLQPTKVASKNAIPHGTAFQNHPNRSDLKGISGFVSLHTQLT